MIEILLDDLKNIACVLIAGLFLIFYLYCVAQLAIIIFIHWRDNYNKCVFSIIRCLGRFLNLLDYILGIIIKCMDIMIIICMCLLLMNVCIEYINVMIIICMCLLLMDVCIESIYMAIICMCFYILYFH